MNVLWVCFALHCRALLTWIDFGKH